MSKGAIEAIVMAGGKGTRLMPYTTVLPKPLMPLGDAPVLEYLLRKLHSHGVRHVCLAVNHLRHLIQAFFGNGSALGLSIEYAVEDKPLGTCGPVSQVLDRMADRFLLLNGDLVTDLDLAQLMSQHRQREADATVSVLKRSSQLEYGVIDTNATGSIIGIREKPRTDYLVSMGVYALTRDSIRSFLVPGRPLDMPDLLSEMVKAERRVNAYFADCDWLDIGRPEDYTRAQAMAAKAAANEMSS